MVGKIVRHLRAMPGYLAHRAPAGGHIERFEMQRLAPDQRRHLWLSFICCVALLG
ncbi:MULTISPECIES: hypothetical protein [unclassified Cupriavidus]|uniref:hypothetical protein n=1 Tax=unclassified Cupriavidus TaxID=2640874 RepID=UPI00088F6673|nr:hypothetical protein [Cupriavidus sp. YR651]SDD37725.1 hypothetical protein SAMN05216345_108167 [Cupriavidus sp. YR651]